MLTASYVGSLGRRLQTVFELNPITPAGQAACLADINCSDPANQIGADFHGLDFPGNTLFGNGDIFSSMHSVASTGKSNYNSLQVSATKGRSHGLIFQASYTYSHALDDGSGFENVGFANAPGGGSRGYNQFFPNLSYGNAAFDARHRFVFSPVYDIPALEEHPRAELDAGRHRQGLEGQRHLDLLVRTPVRYFLRGGRILFPVVRRGPVLLRVSGCA
ncbi:MAG: hypothetical protein ACRD24_14630 [Terriglobales bacterium]